MNRNHPTSADPSAPDISNGRLRRMAPKVAATLVSTLVMVSILWGTDLYFHRKHGINLWGYRGPALGRKQSGEKRVAILGGSTAWGFGLKAGQDFPAQLQKEIAERPKLPGTDSVKILNLAYNSEGAFSFKYTLHDYAYLDYDAVVLYTGYNDLWKQNFIVARHRSPIFLWTGYFPLLPALTMDKISVWTNRLTHGDKPVVFVPPKEDNPDAGEQTSKALQKQTGPLTGSAQSQTGAPDGTCPTKWQFYCQQVYEAADQALKDGKQVLIVTEPYISDDHVEQQRALEGMLSKRFEGQTRLRYLNLGRSVNLQDRSLCWDGMHLTEEGNRRIAAALIQPVTELLEK
jgi:lysophospholipase L1-like esterase